MTGKLSRYLRILSLFLAMLFMIIIFSDQHNIYAASHLDATITHSCSLQSNIGVFYKVKINSKDTFTNVRLHLEKQVFSGPSSTYTWEEYDLTDYTLEDGCYVFAFNGISSVEMNNIIKATVYADKGTMTCYSDKDKFTAAEYITSVLTEHQSGTTESDKALRSLCVDMLNYGAAAQKYFNINTSSLPNSKLTSTQKGYASALPTSFSSCYNYKALNNASCNMQLITLADDANIIIKAYMTFTGTPSSNTFMVVTYKAVSGQDKTITAPINYDSTYSCYVADVEGISSPDFKTPLTMVVKSGSKAISGTYTTSVETCMKDIYAVGNDSLKSLLKYSMALSNSSKAYFTQPSAIVDPVTPTPSVTTLPTVVTDTPDLPTPTGDHVTYEQFGAKGDGVTNDYQAIVDAHNYANEHNLPVVANDNATYYISHMDPGNPQGAIIKTDTYWGKAKFIIDDQSMGTGTSSPEQDCYLFTVAPTVAKSKKWINTSRYWRKSGNTYTAIDPEKTTVLSTDIKIYLGLDPNLDIYPEYVENDPKSNGPVEALAQINKKFDKNTTSLQGKFDDKCLYVLKSESLFRFGRNGEESSSAGLVPQTEVIIVDENGNIDPNTHLQWDWDLISGIEKCPMDDTLLTVSGGKFYTKVNILDSQTYIHRGISITRSNVLMYGVEHYLFGEEAQYNSDSAVGENYYPRVGAPYHGFFRLDHCAYVTLQYCKFGEHLNVHNFFNKDGTRNNRLKTAPYDFYAEFAAVVTLDHCSSTTDIMDDTRWGFGTNYCKNLIITNSSLARVDAHKGTYNLTVQDSEIGYWGICAVGFGTMLVERTTIKQKDYFIGLRKDFGSYWDGDIIVNDCTWDLGDSYYVPVMIEAYYDPLFVYGYDKFVENGITYYSKLPTNIIINNLTIDASKLDNVLITAGRFGIQVFSPIFYGVKDEITQDYLNDKTKYTYPVKVPEKVELNNVTILKPPAYANTKYAFSLRNGNFKNVKDEYFYAGVPFYFNGKQGTFFEI
ncbi:MAG: hypothetical protein K6F83_08965 [Clostridiales bacterium]|nr:hypothetical protein [Clostridiales bacterium]